MVAPDVAYGALYEANRLTMDAYGVTQSTHDRWVNRLDRSLQLDYSTADLRSLSELEKRRKVAFSIVDEIQVTGMLQRPVDAALCRKILAHADTFVKTISPLTVDLRLFNVEEIGRLQELDRIIQERQTQLGGDGSVHRACDRYVRDCLDTLRVERWIFLLRNYVSVFYFLVLSDPAVFTLTLLGMVLTTLGSLVYVYFKRKYVLFGCHVGYATFWAVFTPCGPEWRPGRTDLDRYQVGAVCLTALGASTVVGPVVIMLANGAAKSMFLKSLVATCQLNALKIYAMHQKWTTKNRAFDFYTDAGKPIDLMDKPIVDFVTNKTNTALLFYGLTYREIYETPWAFSILPKADMTKGSLLLYQEFSEVNSGVLLFFVRSLTWCVYKLRDGCVDGLRSDLSMVEALRSNSDRLRRALRKRVARPYGTFWTKTAARWRLWLHVGVVYPCYRVRLMFVHARHTVPYATSLLELLVSAALLFGQPAVIAYLVYPVEKNLDWLSFLDRRADNHSFPVARSGSMVSDGGWVDGEPVATGALLYFVAFVYHVSGIISTLLSVVLVLLFHNSVARTVLVLVATLVCDVALGLVLYTFNISLERRIYIHLFKKLAPILPVEPKLSTTLCVANLSNKFHLIFVPELLRRRALSEAASLNRENLVALGTLSDTLTAASSANRS